MFDKTDLVRLVTVTMPFGKYEGRVLIDIPEEYLLWLSKKGLPQGQLGMLLGLALEIKINGLEGLLKPLRATAQPGGAAADTLH
ncbi:MAG: DUF3820 family protein [Pseudomonadota bacterium]|nr:DUF3820 family protein [Pseudomonadota bacterium]